MSGALFKQNPSGNKIRNGMFHGVAYWYFLRAAHPGPFPERLPAVYFGKSVNETEKIIERATRLAAHELQTDFSLNFDAYGELMRVHKDNQQHAIDLQSSICLAGLYEYGFPTIEIGHKLAASLFATTPCEDEPKLPFPVFMINLPNDLLFANDIEGNSTSLGPIVCGKLPSAVDGKPYWFFVIGSDSKMCMYKSRLQYLEFISSTAEWRGDGDSFGCEIEDLDVRNHILISRLVSNVAMVMTAKQFKRTGGAHKTWANNRQRWRKEPQRRIFKLTQPVRHDFRRMIRDYSTGVIKKLSVQSFVRGHWKRQPHGPERSLRRWIFVEPYWRGPEDAPIALRKHVLA